MYETGGMRRTHLRRHDNIIKRMIIHASACNLGLVMRKLLRNGTPRGFQERRNALLNVIQVLWRHLPVAMTKQWRRSDLSTVILAASVTAYRIPLLPLNSGGLRISEHQFKNVPM